MSNYSLSTIALIVFFGAYALTAFNIIHATPYGLFMGIVALIIAIALIIRK